MRRWAAVAVSLALFAPQSAHASPREECISSSMDGQTLRLKGKLHAARLKLRECSNSACPKLIRHDCVDWLGKLASAMPTIVIGALDGAGKDVADVHVSLDGDALPFPLDGKPIEVDPGSHTLHFEKAGAQSVDQTLLVREGEKDRLVTATVAPAPAPALAAAPAVVPSSGPSPWTWVVGGAGIATLAATAVVGTISLSKYNSLHDGCAVTHSCASGDVGTVNTLYDVAYTTAIIGTALVITSVVLYLTTRHPHAEGAAEHAVIAPGNAGGSFSIRF